MNVIAPLKVNTVFRLQKEYWIVLTSFVSDTPKDSIFYSPNQLFLHSCEPLLSNIKKLEFFMKKI